MMLVAAPFILSAAVGLLFRRAWQRIAFAGTGAACIYAAVFYSMQLDMVRRGPLAGAVPAQPLQVAIEIALVALPIGLCTGVVFHLITRFFRTEKA